MCEFMVECKKSKDPVVDIKYFCTVFNHNIVRVDNHLLPCRICKILKSGDNYDEFIKRDYGGRYFKGAAHKRVYPLHSEVRPTPQEHPDGESDFDSSIHQT